MPIDKLALKYCRSYVAWRDFVRLELPITPANIAKANRLESAKEKAHAELLAHAAKVQA